MICFQPYKLSIRYINTPAHLSDCLTTSFRFLGKKIEIWVRPGKRKIQSATQRPLELPSGRRRPAPSRSSFMVLDVSAVAAVMPREGPEKLLPLRLHCRGGLHRRHGPHRRRGRCLPSIPRPSRHRRRGLRHHDARHPFGPIRRSLRPPEFRRHCGTHGSNPRQWGRRKRALHRAVAMTRRATMRLGFLTLLESESEVEG